MTAFNINDLPGRAADLLPRTLPVLPSSRRRHRRHTPRSTSLLCTLPLRPPVPAFATVLRAGRPLAPPLRRRTGGALCPAYYITPSSGLPAMAHRPPAPCPICGGRPVRKRPWLAGASIGACGIGASLRPANSREAYLKCHWCMTEYVDTGRDVRALLRGLHVERRAAFQVRCYYGRGMTARRLLAEHSTAVVRRVRSRRSILSVSVDGDELIACFLHGGVRTFGSLVRRDDGPGGTSRYAFRSLSRA